MSTGLRRDAVLAGAKAATALAVAAFPFGVVYGVTVVESSVDRWVGIAASWLILAGAAQLSLISLIDDGSAWYLAVLTALVINARFALYSTAVAPAFREFPARWRVGLAYLLTDQAAPLSLARCDTDTDPDSRRSFVLGAGLFFASGWWVGTVVGVFGGAVIPDELDLSFAVPAMFIALAVPAVTDRPALVAAMVAVVVAVAGAPLPNGLNVVVAAVVGIAAGRLVVRSPEVPSS